MWKHSNIVKKTLFVLGTLAIASAVVALVVVKDSPYKVYVVRTESMAPTIPPRSAVIVRVHEYRIGQIISFHVADRVLTHRFVAVDSDGTIVTKADNNETIDPWRVQPSAVIGGVVAAPRMVGYWLRYLVSPFGLASILFGGLAILEIATPSKRRCIAAE